MADFPEDVMIAAREAAAKAWAEDGLDLQREFKSGMRDGVASVRSAASAIMAERQRCADIAYRACAETRHVKLGEAARKAITQAE